MASLARLQNRSREMRLEYQSVNREAEDHRANEHAAAVKIQSWFHGCRVRAYLRYLHKLMTVIQKWWRGYLARKYFRQMVKTAHFIMKMDFYNAMAVRIQRRWRGYYVRKHVHNYYALKKYLEGVEIKNQLVREELEQFAALKKMESQKRDLDNEEKRKDCLARKMHYLLSTTQLPGVFNSPFREFPDPMEIRLQMSKPGVKIHHKKKDENRSSISVSLFAAASIPTLKPLPPIGTKKPQGPFRDTAEVWRQRCKPLDPTLRVATSITSVEEARERAKKEEWVRRINDKDFVTVCSSHKKEAYEPSIHASSEYRPISRKGQRLREEQQKKWQSAKVLCGTGKIKEQLSKEVM